MDRRLSHPAHVQTISFGFYLGRDRQGRMKVADQHNEIEINFVDRGELTLHHGSNLYTIREKNAVIYWAATPHQVIFAAPKTDIFWLVLPLSWFLAWNLGAALTKYLLHGHVLQLSTETSEWLAELPLGRWAREFKTGAPELRRAVELELEASFRRLAFKFQPRGKMGRLKSLPSFTDKLQSHSIQKMVRFITERADESITVRQVAAEAGLNAEYAMRLFRKHWGMTIWTFLLQQRISKAKRLLVLGNTKIADIAFECGFNSLSRFYSAFSKHCQCSPLVFRNQNLGNAQRGSKVHAME